jgi:hypothetical protein
LPIAPRHGYAATARLDGGIRQKLAGIIAAIAGVIAAGPTVKGWLN